MRIPQPQTKFSALVLSLVLDLEHPVGRGKERKIECEYKYE